MKSTKNEGGRRVLVDGCIINTTCELVIGELEEYEYDVEFLSNYLSLILSLKLMPLLL